MENNLWLFFLWKWGLPLGWVLPSQGFGEVQSLARLDSGFFMWHLLEKVIRWGLRRSSGRTWGHTVLHWASGRQWEVRDTLATSACETKVSTKLWTIQELYLILKSTPILRYRKTKYELWKNGKKSGWTAILHFIKSKDTSKKCLGKNADHGEGKEFWTERIENKSSL